MLLRYNKTEKGYEDIEVKYSKLRMHKLTWLLLIFTLMFEHYQLATWYVLNTRKYLETFDKLTRIANKVNVTHALGLIRGSYYSLTATY